MPGDVVRGFIQRTPRGYTERTGGKRRHSFRGNDPLSRQTVAEIRCRAMLVSAQALLCVQPVSAIGWLAGAFTVMMTIGLFTMILSRERFTQGVKSLEDTNPLAQLG